MQTKQIEPAEIIAEQAAEHLCEIRRLDDIAFAFLRATDGDEAAALNMLDDCLNLLFEDGALSMWRYRIVVTKIREGL